jgi:hypothetical protein
LTFFDDTFDFACWLQFFENKSYPNFGSPKPADFGKNQIPGVLVVKRASLIPTAEIIPVEPDQDNTCAGKVRTSLLSFPVFVNPVGP